MSKIKIFFIILGIILVIKFSSLFYLTRNMLPESADNYFFYVNILIGVSLASIIGLYLWYRNAMKGKMPVRKPIIGTPYFYIVAGFWVLLFIQRINIDNTYASENAISIDSINSSTLVPLFLIATWLMYFYFFLKAATDKRIINEPYYLSLIFAFTLPLMSGIQESLLLFKFNYKINPNALAWTYDEYRKYSDIYWSWQRNMHNVIFIILALLLGYKLWKNYKLKVEQKANPPEIN